MASLKYGAYYVPEHRLIMAEYIGRALRKEEEVHHENEFRDDNRIENLRLFHTKSAHTAYHRKKDGRRPPIYRGKAQDGF